MAKHLVIVESPAKAKSIGKYLGKDYQVEASVGHIRDLPKSKLGVDIEKDFEPQYQVIKDKTDVVKDLKAAAKDKKTVLLATDPDREGEAIAWHLSYLLTNGTGAIKCPIKRVLFEEITKGAVLESIKAPRDIDKNMFESQQARRVLDRLVGYQVSPVLWDKVRRGLSAGRVQTVALRIVCEREKEIRAFVAQEYWSIIAKLQAKNPPTFEAYLYSFDGKRLGKDYTPIANEAHALELYNQIKDANFKVNTIKTKERRRRPSPPFTTSKLQQEASRKLGYQPRRTMKIAQELYEGIDIGDGEGPVGLITYMRTDSTRISPVALQELLAYIPEKFGKQYLPATPYEYKVSKNAQEAHEAIRPTSAMREPQAIKKYLSPEQLKLYELIWKRMVASQMAMAVFDQTSVDIQADKALFRATGNVMKFDGFIKVYLEGKDDVPQEKKESEDEEEGDDSEAELPKLTEGEVLKLKELLKNQHFTQPPPRFTQATLIKELEEKGIGRPSTYASIMSTILNKSYVDSDKSKRLVPSELGMLVADLLVGSFPVEFDVGFTAKLENQLDEISADRLNWVVMMREFYTSFSEHLKQANVSMRNVKAQEIPSGLKCPKCGNDLNIRWGRNGEFLACKSYKAEPPCSFTSNFEKDEAGNIKIVEAPKIELTDVPCPKCSKPTVIRVGRFGPFRGCSGYPECRFIEPINAGPKIEMKCPICKQGDIVQRKSRWGKMFYGCSKYSKNEDGCKFISNHRPLERPCPKCNNGYLVIKERKTGNILACPQEECDFNEPYVEPPAPAEAPKEGT